MPGAGAAVAVGGVAVSVVGWLSGGERACWQSNHWWSQPPSRSRPPAKLIKALPEGVRLGHLGVEGLRGLGGLGIAQARLEFQFRHAGVERLLVRRIPTIPGHLGQVISESLHFSLVLIAENRRDSQEEDHADLEDDQSGGRRFDWVS